jgi:hypothetical protein
MTAKMNPLAPTARVAATKQLKQTAVGLPTLARTAAMTRRKTMSSIFNKSKCKERILHIAHIKGRTRFTRVSMAEMEPKMEAAMVRWLNAYIHQLPSLGRTIK